MCSHSFFNIFAYVSATITLEEEIFANKLSRVQKLVKFKKSTSDFGLLEHL